MSRPSGRDRASGTYGTGTRSQGAVQGAARSITDRLVDKFLTNPPDWLRTLWHMLPRP
ncbi:hypothetical protein AB0F30_36440 [Streptomyces sp. NPDC029006]